MVVHVLFQYFVVVCVSLNSNVRIESDTGNKVEQGKTNHHDDPNKTRFPLLSKPSLDLLLRILQSPITPVRLAPNGTCLLGREPLGLDSRVVAQPRDASDLVRLEGRSHGVVGAAVDGDDDSTPKPQVVLQTVPCLRDGAVVGPAAEVPDELGALGDAGGAERVALGDEAPRGVDDVLAAVGDVAVADELVGLALVAEPEGVNDNHLVGAEAVVQLDDLDVPRRDARLLGRRPRRPLVHAVAHEVDGAAREERRVVGRHALTGDLDGLRAEVRPRLEKGLGHHNGRGAAVRRRAALQLGERLVDRRRLDDLVERVHLLELRVRVARRVGVVDACNLCEILCLCAVPL